MPMSIAGLRWVPAPTANAVFAWYRTLYLHIVAFLHYILPHRQLPPLDSPDCEGTLASINVGAGIPKRPVVRALVTGQGLLGDKQLTGFLEPWGGHGGADKAVMLWSKEVIEQVASEGHPMCQSGRCGEQLTLAGIDWRLVKTGATVRIGASVLLEVTFLKMPCGAQQPNFTDAGSGMQRISPQYYPDSSRVLARVLQGGHVMVGDTVALHRSPHATSGVVVRSRIYATAFVSQEYNTVHSPASSL